MKLSPWLLFLLAVAAVALFFLNLDGSAQRRKIEARADSALADYHRLAADSARTAGRERLKDAEADSLRRRIAHVEAAARDSIAAVKQTLAALDVQAATSLPLAQTVRDSMDAYRDLYTAQRVATGRLLAAAALATDSVKVDRDTLVANRERELREARVGRDTWKRQADRLAQSVEELKDSRKILGFIPKPPKWVAATVGCAVGAMLDSGDRARGCGLGGTALAVVTPTRQ